jgi:hypothetical protein
MSIVATVLEVPSARPSRRPNAMLSAIETMIPGQNQAKSAR